MKKVAVIGLGNIAIRHRRNLKQLFPEATLFSMSASGRTSVEAIPYSDVTVANLQALIEEKIELAIVASPATFHAKHTIPLIKANIPTLIEKPVTADVNDLSLLNQAMKEAQTPVAIGYCLRYLPSAIKVKAFLNKDRLGILYNAHIHIGQYLPDWRPKKNYRKTVSANKHLGGGALLELSHEIDYVQWFLGDCNVEYALLRSSEELGLDVEDVVDLVLRSNTDVVANIHLDFLQRPAQRNCSLVGSQGRLDWDLINNTVTYYGPLGSEVIYSNPKWDTNEMYLSMIKNFLEMIEHRDHQCVELNEAGKTIQLIEKIKMKNNWNNRR
jgi:predicted dehydrogenase